MSAPASTVGHSGGMALGDAAPALLPYGLLGGTAVHLCIDMQTMFAGRTDWHVPWMQRVLPAVERLARAQPQRTIFTRFVPPETPDELGGAWRRYYHRWEQMTRAHLDPALISLVPQLLPFVPPAIVLDKQHYSPFAEPALQRCLQERGIDALVVSGAETDVCVLATVLAAVDLGYRVIVVADAVCSASDLTHDALLTLYTQRFGQQIEVANVETVLRVWR
ncbi:MAG: cysteine hydrolase family protein [Acetobacteraceae bacterium]